MNRFKVLVPFLEKLLLFWLVTPRKMKIIQQRTKLPVDNHDLEQVRSDKHSLLLPSSIRCIIVGPSNCGKTNVMLTLIEHPNGLKFKNIYLYSKSLHQPKYLFLEKLMKPIKGIGYFAFNNSEEILPPSEAQPHSIFIFDDVACDKQDTIRRYFSMGRHNHIDCFYLCQTYAKIPKHLIRDNANTLILFKQDDTSLKHVYNDHVGTDMSFDKFKAICGICWNKPYRFLAIFKENKINEGRYRCRFDKYISL